MHLFIYSLALYGFSVVAASRATLFCNTQAFHHCGFSCVAQALGTWALGVAADSVVVAYGLSCFTECGIFPARGSNPCHLLITCKYFLSYVSIVFFPFSLIMSFVQKCLILMERSSLSCLCMLLVSYLKVHC